MDRVTITEVADFFGGIPELAARLKTTPQAIYQWGDVIPELRAYQIERLSGGRFKAQAMNPKSIAVVTPTATD